MENKIISGIWFICIGLLLLLHNLDVVAFNFWAVLKYWPLCIILLGVNLMVQNRAYGGYIKIVCNVLFLGWIIFKGITTPYTGWHGQIFNNKSFSFDHADEDEDLQHAVSLPYTDSVQNVHFDFNGGAGNFDIQPTTADLLKAVSDNQNMGLRLENKSDNNNQSLTLIAKPKGTSKDTDRLVTMQLHTAPVWDMVLNYGAAELSGDLSAFKIKNLEINTGASSMDLKLGLPQLETMKIKVATGASTIQLRIPKEAAVRVKYTSVASTTNLEGLNSTKKGLAQSDNYDTADKKLDIQLDGAANTFTISRY